MADELEGELLVTSDLGVNGKKRFHCSIEIDAWLVDRPECWRTVLHESIHAFSAGYGTDYFHRVGWEEGVVELLQRELRKEVFERAGIHYDEDSQTPFERNHPYNAYVEALRSFAGAVEMTPRELGVLLLAIPLRDRSSVLLEKVRRSPGLIAAYSSLNAVLSRSPR